MTNLPSNENIELEIMLAHSEEFESSYTFNKDLFKKDGSFIYSDFVSHEHKYYYMSIYKANNYNGEDIELFLDYLRPVLYENKLVVRINDSYSSFVSLQYIGKLPQKCIYSLNCKTMDLSNESIYRAQSNSFTNIYLNTLPMLIVYSLVFIVLASLLKVLFINRKHFVYIAIISILSQIIAYSLLFVLFYYIYIKNVLLIVLILLELLFSFIELKLLKKRIDSTSNSKLFVVSFLTNICIMTLFFVICSHTFSMYY